MFFYLLLLFVCMPIIELVILLWLAGVMGAMTTVLLVLITGTLGAALARKQGFDTIMRIRTQVNKGKVPADAMLDGVLILSAGLVLITPGVITDVTGFFLLIPPCRLIVKKGLRHYFTHHASVKAHWHVRTDKGEAGGDFESGGPRESASQQVIDVEARELDDSET